MTGTKATKNEPRKPRPLSHEVVDYYLDGLDAAVQRADGQEPFSQDEKAALKEIGRCMDEIARRQLAFAIKTADVYGEKIPDDRKHSRMRALFLDKARMYRDRDLFRRRPVAWFTQKIKGLRNGDVIEVLPG